MKLFKASVLALLIVVSISFAQNNTETKDMTGKIGISLTGGLGIPTNGNYPGLATLIPKSTDIFNLGPQFGLGVDYYLTPEIGIELNCGYGFNYYKDDYKFGKEPVVSVLNVSLNGVYNFGNMMKASIVFPIARAGVGMYSWSHLDDGLGGEVLKYGQEDFKATSFGFNVGIGADFAVMKNFTIGVMCDYNMYFPKDENKFGTNFAEQGYFTPQLKLSYYIPTK